MFTLSTVDMARTLCMGQLGSTVYVIAHAPHNVYQHVQLGHLSSWYAGV